MNFSLSSLSHLISALLVSDILRPFLSVTYQLCKQVKAAAVRVRTADAAAAAARARAAACSGDAEDSPRDLLRRVRP